MKKVKYLLISLIMLCCTITVNAESEGPFYFDWDNELIGADIEGDIEYSDNIGYKNGVVTIKSIYRDGVYTLIERYDNNGKLLYDNTIEYQWFYSMITDQEYVYAIIENGNGTVDMSSAPEDADGNIKMIKLNEKMEIVDEIVFKEATEPGTDGMVNARRFGHDILAVDENNIYVYCGEDYMLKISKEFDEWEVLEYTEELSAQHFPDLTKEYEILAGWMEEVNNGNYLIDYLVTAHVYEDYYLTSGMKYTTTSPIAIFKLYDNENNLIIEKTNEDYAKFIQGRVIKDYIVLIALVWDANYNTTSSDILVYDMEGNLLQTISSGNIYHMLNETKSGFVVTNVENTCSTTSSGKGIAGIEDVRGELKTEYCDNYNNEVYYLQLNIETKINGEGTIEVVENSKAGENVTFIVNPKEGFVLSEVRVTDKNGNVVTFTDYTFTMPSADVTIEVVFAPENPDTAEIAVIAIIVLATIGGLSFVISKRKLNWLK